MKKILMVLMMVVFLAVLTPVSTPAASSDVTLAWDASIDAPYLASYRVYYYPTSGNPASLTTALYAVSYTLAGGNPVPILQTDPKAITIDKSNLQITLNGLPDGKYYFAVTAIDTRGLESVPTPEISASLKTIIYPPTNTRVVTVTIRTAK